LGGPPAGPHFLRHRVVPTQPDTPHMLATHPLPIHALPMHPLPRQVLSAQRLPKQRLCIQRLPAQRLAGLRLTGHQAGSPESPACSGGAASHSVSVAASLAS
jgi:hypothetical protein